MTTPIAMQNAEPLSGIRRPNVERKFQPAGRIGIGLNLALIVAEREFQSAGRIGIGLNLIVVERETGLEPASACLGSRYSTN